MYVRMHACKYVKYAMYAIYDMQFLCCSLLCCIALLCAMLDFSTLHSKPLYIQFTSQRDFSLYMSLPFVL